jgi:pyruvate,water dikinase
LISEMALTDLRTFLAEHRWDEDPDVLAHRVSAGGRPSRTVVSDAELYEVGTGTRSLHTWLADHGHRAAGEFDLAASRWREQPALVQEMARRLASGDCPLKQHHRHAKALAQWIEAFRGPLSRSARAEFDRHLDLVRRYVAFREDAKDVLMRGYDLLRDLALEAGQRLEIGPDVFFLTREDFFDALRVGYAPFHLIEQRKTVYGAEARLSLPHVIDGSAIDTLGSVPERKAPVGGVAGLPISWGEAAGPVRVCLSPSHTGDLGRGYILVCPSTDPSWTPLFVNAAGLVLERGGMLSHGAVVARELGLPAVVLPNATQLFRDGAAIHVDGHCGWVSQASPTPVEAGSGDGASTSAAVPDPDDLRIPYEQTPPPPGRKDRRAAKVRNALAAAWSAYLLACFLLPEGWVYQPTFAVLDSVLWPMVRSLGKPTAVALIAVSMALLMLLVQKLMTDNGRLLEAKRRAAALQKRAQLLPQGAPRRAVMVRLAAPIPRRTLGAALVPVGILLGPMLLSFIWFKERVDPAAWNAPAGSAVQIVALVESDWREPVRIEVPLPMTVDETTPAARTLPPLRQTLERLLVLYRQPRELPGEPWELRAAPDLGRQQTADDLQAYLAAGMPPQGMTWLIRPPENLSGRFPVAVTTPGHPPVIVPIVLGDDCPPTPLITWGGTGAAIKEVRVIFPKPKVEPVFWQPLGCLGIATEYPFTAWLAGLNVSWLLLYILAYLATLLLFKAALRVA